MIIILPAMNTMFAQLNESDTALFQLRTSLTGNYQKGNLKVFTLRNKVEFSVTALSDMVFKSENAMLYQSFYSRKTDQDLYSRNYLYYQPHKKLYPFAIAYINTNFRRQIDWRYFTVLMADGNL